jgi:hypothetical protein
VACAIDCSILNLSDIEVEEVRILGQSESQLRKLIDRFSMDNSDFKALVMCYTVANFLRGLYIMTPLLD